MRITGADPGFQVRGGAHLKKLRQAEGGAKILGVFRVKNHDFTPKNHIFSNCGGRREKCWGISCEKSRLYTKNHIFSNFRRGGAPGAPPPPGSAPKLMCCSTIVCFLYSFCRSLCVLFSFRHYIVFVCLRLKAFVFLFGILICFLDG